MESNHSDETDKPAGHISASPRSTYFPRTDAEKEQALTLASNHRKRAYKFYRAYWITAGLSFCLLFIGIASHLFWLADAAIAIGIMGVLFVGCAGSFTDRWKDETRRILESEDVHAIPLLIDMLQEVGRYRTPEKPVKQALVRLLPRLQPHDINLLTTKQRDNLYFLLMGTDIPLVLAILKAMEQIGDRQAVSYVRKLASGEWAAHGNAEARKAARHCLPVLEEHIQQQNGSQTLLRPGNAPNDTLLRPAKGTASAGEDPQQMVRPSQSDQSPTP